MDNTLIGQSLSQECPRSEKKKKLYFTIRKVDKTLVALL